VDCKQGILNVRRGVVHLRSRILVINTGSTSTKVAIFEDEKSILDENLVHPQQDILARPTMEAKLAYREAAVRSLLGDRHDFTAIAVRGGLLRPVAAGTYEVNETMVADSMAQKRGEHASNLGPPLAKRFADAWNIKAYVTDPVSVDEFEPVARLSGLPEIERQSFSHALNLRAVARLACEDMGKLFTEANVVVVHLGGGTSVCPIRRGRIIDVNNANEEGPFSAERTGGLPVGDLARLCFSGKYTEKQLVKKITTEGGVFAYLGTKDIREVLKMIAEGDQKARLVLDAMIYQTAKEIGAMATALKGDVDAIVVSGGVANAAGLMDDLKKRVSFIAPFMVYPGGDEMEALALGALRVASGTERPLVY
jgi:butyrate kinase